MLFRSIVYPLIGGIPLAKLLPMTLEEMCEELRKRPGRGGNCIKETTVQKYLETVSSVLEDAKKNDIIPFNPAHRVRKKHFEKEVQHIPQKYEIRKLMQAIRDEPILYRAYYTLAITTGLRRGELCALQWRDITGACELTVCRSRSCASGQIVESDTKSHRRAVCQDDFVNINLALRFSRMHSCGNGGRSVHKRRLCPAIAGRTVPHAEIGRAHV